MGDLALKHSVTGYVINIITYKIISMPLSELSYFIGMNY